MWRFFRSFSQLPRPTSLLHTTSPSPSSMDLKTLTEILERLAPTNAAEPWDNVGLLVEPSNPHTIKRLLITNDLTEQVLQEALDSPKGKPGLIVSYHPPLFKAFKKLTQKSAKERIVVRALEEGIAIYSPHTSLDNMEGGINDWLLSAVGEGEVVALRLRKHSAHFSNVMELMGAGVGESEKLVKVLSELYGVSKICSSASNVTAECTDESLATLLPRIKRDFPMLYISLSANSKIMPTLSGGKLLTVKESDQSTLSEVVKRIKAHLKLKHIQVARPHNIRDESLVTSAAACAGSGGSVLEGVKADLLLTGEMSHHQVLDATSRGSVVVVCGHTNTERGFLQGTYKNQLDKACEGQVEVSIAATDKDPLEIV